MANSLWASARLIFRGVDTEDDDFFVDLGIDPVSYLNSAPLIPLPRSRKLATEYREWLQKDSTLMAAIICIAPSKEDEKQHREREREQEHATSMTVSGAADKKEKDKNKQPAPKPIGVISLHSPEPRMIHHRRADIGIQVLPEFQGQGYGTEALLWAMKWGFKRANLHRISIGYFSWNERAGRLYHKLGFKQEGRMRDYFWHDGQYHDAIESSILEDEWRELYGNEA